MQQTSKNKNAEQKIIWLFIALDIRRYRNNKCLHSFVNVFRSWYACLLQQTILIAITKPYLK